MRNLSFPPTKESLSPSQVANSSAPCPVSPVSVQFPSHYILCDPELSSNFQLPTLSKIPLLSPATLHWERGAQRFLVGVRIYGSRPLSFLGFLKKETKVMSRESLPDPSPLILTTHLHICTEVHGLPSISYSLRGKVEIVSFYQTVLPFPR